MVLYISNVEHTMCVVIVLQCQCWWPIRNVTDSSRPYRTEASVSNQDVIHVNDWCVMNGYQNPQTTQASFYCTVFFLSEREKREAKWVTQCFHYANTGEDLCDTTFNRNKTFCYRSPPLLTEPEHVIYIPSLSVLVNSSITLSITLR